MIHGMMLVKNEADRWLIDVIAQMKYICDRLVILDDGSTDGTIDICKKFTKEVYQNKESLWGKNELLARQKLWNLTTAKAEYGDWIICLDADELLVEGHLDYLKYIMNINTSGIDSIGFKLHDMWNRKQYRHDRYWTAHLRYWAMAVKYTAKNYTWHDKSLHCGRFPNNASTKTLATQIPIKHMGWSREEDRQKKYKRYIEVDPQGKNGILAQYESILDKDPILVNFGGVC